MEVKTDAIRTPGDGVEITAPASSPWWEDKKLAVEAKEAAQILGWDNPNSVRNRARQGGFRWRQRGNGRLVFHRTDVVEYAARHTAAEAA